VSNSRISLLDTFVALIYKKETPGSAHIPSSIFQSKIIMIISLQAIIIFASCRVKL